ncbi:MAG: GNAT family N-acetyltransferase [Candidatus Koribacter versatilis]|uniref:GNAT family N-acetyltransferase n=1 Tax=Candidatus Korobacter versatilis TaxID=658062 RepID=A0A932A985_9BACT|nr:GNAT family N-acetyltransferase [Candidatus Koribacter versatilis]
MNFELQPTLRGKLLELRPLAPDDFDALYAAASDPKIWEQHPEADRYQRDVFRKFFDSAIASRGAFAVVERKAGKLIGSSRYTNLDAGSSEIEIGWTFLARAFWGGQYNGEMKALMLEHAFRFVERVVFTVGENNLRSQKAVEKIGGNLFGRNERPGLDGAMRANVVLAITKAEWEKRKR